jgi:hypothetical protein
MVFAVATGEASAVPARPLYVPEVPAKAVADPMLANTVWAGTLFAPDCNVHFHPDGTLHLVGPDGGRRPGAWKRVGNIVSFQINQYGDFKTVITGNGNAMRRAELIESGQQYQQMLYRIDTMPPIEPAIPAGAKNRQ